jgi:small subunit ribosomal protein S17
MAHTLQGTVVSDKRDKTITVAITYRETHPLYKKQYTRTRKYTAHDEQNAAKLGDKVEIEETRPISATKHYKLIKVLEKSHELIELKEEQVVPEKPAKVEKPAEEETK